jgi:3-hydroxyethyl bacteriochlorophyllide a dehydrogenase
MHTTAIVMEQPERLALRQVDLADPHETDVVVDVDWSGISTGTERLLWNGSMPNFPGMGYPLVPGYESVGRVREAGSRSGRQRGETVFVAGARCFGSVNGLFGAAAATLVVPGERAIPISEDLGVRGVLLALAATAYHSVAGGGRRDPIQPPDLIVGHGVLGRLLARMTVLAEYPAPTVWETNPDRFGEPMGYPVVHPDKDPRRDYQHIYDVSGDPAILDRAIARLAFGGEVVLAGFYTEPLSFNFAPAFMREASIRVAAEWKRADMLAVHDIAESGLLPLDDLITHHAVASDAERAYRTAFSDSQCLKMVIDWRGRA